MNCVNIILISWPYLVTYCTFCTQCRSTSKLHPKTHQPLHFICTSLKQDESCVLAKEADLIDEGKREAEAVLDAVKKYCTEYPKEWGSDLRDMPFLESICIVTPWRKQVCAWSRYKRAYGILEILMRFTFDSLAVLQISSKLKFVNNCMLVLYYMLQICAA